MPKYKTARTLKPSNKQTGKRKDIKLDRKRKALAPGKRRSKNGNIYYEYRRTKSDLTGKRI